MNAFDGTPNNRVDAELDLPIVVPPSFDDDSIVRDFDHFPPELKWDCLRFLAYAYNNPGAVLHRKFAGFSCTLKVDRVVKADKPDEHAGP